MPVARPVAIAGHGAICTETAAIEENVATHEMRTTHRVAPTVPCLRNSNPL
jgi:hypothetical protein